MNNSISRKSQTNTIQMEALGDRIREASIKKGLTQEQFAEILDMSNTSVSQIERAEFVPSLPVFVLICKFLEVEASILLQDSLCTNMNEYDLEKMKLVNEMDHLSSEQVKHLVDFIKSLH